MRALSLKPVLLLVEDDPIEARRLESALTLLGYETVLAGDGDQALALLARRAFDVVLLDLVLPELDGMGVLGAMGRQGFQVPVVAAVTGEGLDAASSAIRAGARDFVVKPAGALRLQVALANAIALGAGQPAAGRACIPVSPRLIPADAGAPLVPDGRGVEADAIADARNDEIAGVAADGEWVAAGGHVRPLEEIEAQAIRFACAHYDGRLTEVARRLGIGRSTLYRKLSRLGVSTPEDRARDPFDPPLAERRPQIVAAE